MPLLALAAGAGIAIYAGTGLNAKRTLSGLKVVGVKNLKIRRDVLLFDLVVFNAGKTKTTLNKVVMDCYLDGNLVGDISYEGKIKVAPRSAENTSGLTTLKGLRTKMRNGLSIVSSLLDYFGRDEEAKKKVLRLDGTLTADGMNFPFTQDIPFTIKKT